jgi:hypothetical protein
MNPKANELKKVVNWKTANEMNQIALDTINKQTKLLVDNLMKMIEEEAKKGKVKDYFLVGGNRASSIYLNVIMILQSLGYEVEGDIDENMCTRKWLISWE